MVARTEKDTATALLSPLTWGAYLTSSLPFEARVAVTAALGHDSLKELEEWWGKGRKRPRQLTLPTPLDKDGRRSAHHIFKKFFPELDTGTTDDPQGSSGKCLTVRAKKVKRGYQYQERWPDNWPDYLQFVLHKANCGTSTAIGLIAKALNIRSNNIGFVFDVHPLLLWRLVVVVPSACVVLHDLGSPRLGTLA